MVRELPEQGFAQWAAMVPAVRRFAYQAVLSAEAVVPFRGLSNNGFVHPFGVAAAPARVAQ